MFKFSNILSPTSCTRRLAYSPPARWPTRLHYASASDAKSATSAPPCLSEKRTQFKIPTRNDSQGGFVEPKRASQTTNPSVNRVCRNDESG